MTKLDYKKAKRRPQHEREISDDAVTAIVARARGPKKADLRAVAEHAIKAWRPKSQPGDALRASRPVPAFTTAGSMKLHTDAFPWPPRGGEASHLPQCDVCVRTFGSGEIAARQGVDGSHSLLRMWNPKWYCITALIRICHINDPDRETGSSAPE